MNKPQQEAVNAVLGPVITIAGPGSGKTTVITKRLCHMTDELGIEPTSILVITYTKAAAVEMRSRFLTVKNPVHEKVNFGTFHSIFFQILKRHYGYRSENIISSDMTYKIISQGLGSDALLLGGNTDFIRRISDEIAAYKGLEPDKRPQFKSEVLSSERFEEICRHYNSSLSELGLIDFEDMLRKTDELFESRPDILKAWQDKFKYILVDEFQDINPIQYRITKRLARPEGNLFVVGDDDQSIYAFRGSAPEIMQSFKKDFPEAREIHLDINYRSCPEILSAASNLISHNKKRFEKKLESARTDKIFAHPLTIKSFANNDAEYDDLAECIKKLVNEGQDISEIAILTRTNAQSGFVCGKLLAHNIPFSTKAGIPSIYDNRYVQPLTAYLRFLAGDDSRENFLKFMNRPVRYLERASLQNDRVDLDELMEYYEKSEKWYAVKNIQELKNNLRTLKRLDPSSAIHYIRKVMGYDDCIKEDLGLSADLADETLDILDEYEASALPHKTFLLFLSYMEEFRTKLKNALNNMPAKAVNLLTFHGCKGLEFDVVFMPDCIEGITPHKKSRTPDELEEERRMFYVAMTRARHMLILSSSKKRHGHDDLRVSRFISEIRRSQTPPGPGSRIFHAAFQAGTVIKREGDALTVKFDKLLVPKKISYTACMEKGLLEIL